MGRHSILIGELQKELTELEELVQRTQALLQKLQTTGDEDYIGTLALNLYSFYSGAERAFQSIAITIGDSLPNQQDWHRRLLRQMNIAIPETRPAVLSESTYTGLNDYCSFRHVVRNVYSFKLQTDRVQALAAQLPLSFQTLKQDLDTFCDFLKTLNGIS